jgi:hypothetical protein
MSSNTIAGYGHAMEHPSQLQSYPFRYFGLIVYLDREKWVFAYLKQAPRQYIAPRGKNKRTSEGRARSKLTECILVISPALTHDKAPVVLTYSPIHAVSHPFIHLDCNVVCAADIANYVVGLLVAPVGISNVSLTDPQSIHGKRCLKLFRASPSSDVQGVSVDIPVLL